MFYGRETILNRLERLWQKSTSSLVTVRGRRRIGKSTLIAEFARRSADHFIFIDGQAPGEDVDNAVQLKSFVEQLSVQTAVPNVSVENWLQAFRLLNSALPASGRTVVLLDEISWMGGYDVAFAGTLKIVWDKLLKNHSHLVLVLCGSVSSWIAENILQGTGFVGRDSLDFVVDELPFRDCFSFWGEAGERTALKEKLDFLSVVGGVPKYLEELNPSLTAEENLRELCFTPNGLLFRDFGQIFNQIFGKKSEDRRKILKTLAYGPKTVSEIAESLGKERNGHLSDYLKELELAGFIAKDVGMNPSTGRPAKIANYRIKDNYTRFYLHHIEPHEQEVQAGLFQSPGLESLPGWAAIRGLQFENLVVSNYRALLPILGLDGASLVSAAPFRRQRCGDSEGVQVDLLLMTRATAYVIEIKRCARMGVETADEIEAKIPKIGFRSDCSVRTVLVYDGEIAPTLRTDHKLDFLIPIERMV